MLRRRFIGPVALLVVLAGCSGSGAQISDELCAGKGLEYVKAGWGKEVLLVSSSLADGDSIASWLSADDRPVSDDLVNEWASRGDEAVAVCYYDGDFSGFPAPEAAAATFNRMLLLVPSKGEPWVESVGPQDKLRFEDGPAEPAGL